MPIHPSRPPDRTYLAAKRAFDIALASAGLFALSPLFLVIGVLIRLNSRGPVLFRQLRMGEGGRPFTIYKFRTMRREAPSLGPPITCRDDARITSVGRWLRRHKLDELPQLVNVLRGEMSLVGPRPLVPLYQERFKDEYAEILRIRPGITDYASIFFKDEHELLEERGNPEQVYVEKILPRKIQLNKKYIAERSFCLDAKLVLWTLLRLIRS